MNDTHAGEAVRAVFTLLAFLLPLIAAPFAFKFAGAGMNKLYNGAMKGLQRATSNAAKAGKKGAMNTKYGQMFQQGMANRKAVTSIRAREGALDLYKKNPKLMSTLMGGLSGQEHVSRHFDKESRAKRAEDITNLQRGLTANMASAIGEGDNLTESMRRGVWGNSGRRVSAEDQAAYQKLQQQGYIGQNGFARADSMLATASMHSIMDAEIASDDNIRGLSSMLKGASAEENADFSNELRNAAAKHNYKNFSTASVTDGVLSKYYNKTGKFEDNPVPGVPNAPSSIANKAQRIAGAKKVLKSGIRGLNKDALDESMETDFLDAINETYSADIAAEAKAANKNVSNQQIDQLKRDFIVRMADQTSGIEKTEVIEGIVKQFNGDVSVDDFVAIQRSMKSGGAIQMPPNYTSAAAAPAPTPTPVVVTPAPAAPQPVVIQAPPQSGISGNFTQQPSGLVIPHGTVTMPNPTPRMPSGGSTPPSRPPRGGGPSGPGGTGPNRP